MKQEKQKRRRHLNTLPSLESLTVAFVDAVRNSGRPNLSWDLRFGGFKAYVRYQRDYQVNGEILDEVFVIAKIEIPKQYRRRGWFWRYCQLCLALVKDGVIIETLVNDNLLEALEKRPEFVPISPYTFIVRKTGPGDWPLRFMPGDIYTSNIKWLNLAL